MVCNLAKNVSLKTQRKQQWWSVLLHEPPTGPHQGRPHVSLLLQLVEVAFPTRDLGVVQAGGCWTLCQLEHINPQTKLALFRSQTWEQIVPWEIRDDVRERKRWSQMK
ncbi:hypothetical protein GOP47_0009641 [Adiantum capillus-veneris]|uniref:Uncharacterized protein n=1 Tax=Adiantum capillus-veneris TaxID=13818 RepID=A0A9D4ZJV1_ADICA|nr:hypothetical protein GOP47_0009641 [Adiantum capillus-veneris]